MSPDHKDEEKSFWGSMPGTLIAIAICIIAFEGLIIAINTSPRPNLFFPATALPPTAQPTPTVFVPPTAAPPTAAAPTELPPTARPTSTVFASPTKAPPTITPALLTWLVDTAGVCRDAAGGYPRWSAYNWPLAKCQAACASNPNCQGLAMSKQTDYCQLFGSDGTYASSDPSNPGAQITHGDSREAQYTCYIKER